MQQNSFIQIIVPLVAIAAFVIFLIRFLLGGPEDTWICANGEWIRHGNPAAAKPLIPCGE